MKFMPGAVNFIYNFSFHQKYKKIKFEKKYIKKLDDNFG